MEIKVQYWSTDKYLPSKRHRKTRTKLTEREVSVNIRELTEDEFPLAFVVDGYDKSVDIRTYGGRLYVAAMYGSYVCGKHGYLPLSKISAYLINERRPFDRNDNQKEFTEQSVMLGNDILEVEKRIHEKAADYLIFDGKVWVPKGEPMYVIHTLGLGHNHGGTSFSVAYFYNENIGKGNYFNALERDKGLEYARHVAENRGDTKSIEGLGRYSNIKVLMPEMVKRNPQTEHGDGDPWLNSVETMITGTDSSTEAGILACAMLMR